MIRPHFDDKLWSQTIVARLETRDKSEYLKSIFYEGSGNSFSLFCFRFLVRPFFRDFSYVCYQSKSVKVEIRSKFVGETLYLPYDSSDLRLSSFGQMFKPSGEWDTRSGPMEDIETLVARSQVIAVFRQKDNFHPNVNRKFPWELWITPVYFRSRRLGVKCKTLQLRIDRFFGSGWHCWRILELERAVNACSLRT